MKRSRLNKSKKHVKQRRLKPVYWKVNYGVYERKGNKLEFTGETATLIAKGKTLEEASHEAKKMLDPIYRTYHYTYKIKKVEEA